MSKIIIDLDKIAPIMIRELNIFEEEIEDIKRSHRVPDGWSNMLLDVLQLEYDLETKLLEKIMEKQT